MGRQGSAIRYRSLVELLRHRADLQSDHPAYVFLGHNLRPECSLTFAQLERHARTLAHRLAPEVTRGDRVLLVFPTDPAFIVGFFACLMIGAVAVPIMMPRRNASRDANAAIIADCAPRLALVAPALADRMPIAWRDQPSYHGVPCLPVDLTSSWPAGIAAIEPDPDIDTRDIDHDDLAFLQYTSGSTATPKGVMVTHGNLLSNLEMLRIVAGNDAGSTHVGWLPLYHDMGLIVGALEPLYLGALCVLMSPVSFMFRPLDWLRAIHRYRGKVAAAPNFAFELCVDRFRPELMEGVDLSTWHYAFVGAEPVRAETLRRFTETFAPYGLDAKMLSPAYGLAEATVFVSSGPPSRGPVVKQISASGLQHGAMAAPSGSEDQRSLVGCGLAGQGLALAAVDPASHRRVANGMVGEIWLRGPSAAQGYWGRPAESAAVFRASIEGAQGEWLRTGDLGCLDAEGELYIVGRLKDVIIVRGTNHYPQDLETTASFCHPGLRRDHCAVFGVPAEDGTEQIAVVQEVNRGNPGGWTASEMIAAIRAAIANNHEVTPRSIVLIRPGTLPKTTSGKIQRSLTRQLWADGRLSRWQETRNSTTSVPEGAFGGV
jgi:acyl-CoA synthetase (AMP-forming)/AMP-acid ligase II